MKKVWIVMDNLETEISVFGSQIDAEDHADNMSLGYSVEEHDVICPNDPVCTCDENCDDPCPVHARENELQNENIRLKNQYQDTLGERNEYRDRAKHHEIESNRLREGIRKLTHYGTHPINSWKSRSLRALLEPRSPKKQLRTLENPLEEARQAIEDRVALQASRAKRSPIERQIDDSEIASAHTALAVERILDHLQSEK